MRVLLDEHLDHRLRRSFDPSVEVATVAEQGWKGKKNGELLQLASREFDALITADQNLEYQQNVPAMIWVLWCWWLVVTVCLICSL